MAAQLGNINLFVGDIERARRFYVDVIGLIEDQERSAPPGFFLLAAGGCNLTLQDSSAPGAAFATTDSIELGFAVDDVAAVREQLVLWGSAVSNVQEMGWGSGCDARDPDGHRLTIYRMRD